MTYDAELWNMNGPAVLTYAVNTYCDNPSKEPPPGDYFVALNCANLKMLPAEFGCPVKAGKFEIYYNVTQKETLAEMMRNSVVVHYFNKMRVLEMKKNARDDLRMNENQPLYGLMKTVCPNTEDNILRYMIGGTYWSIYWIS